MFFLFAEGAFGAFREGVAANGITVASWLPYILSGLGAVFVFAQKYGPVLLNAIAAVLKQPNPLVPPNGPAVTTPLSGLDDLVKLFDGNLPLVHWFFSLPADQQAAFWVALKKRLNIQ